MADVLFSDVDHRGFELCLMDMRMLRSMYRRINPDVTHASLNKLPRNFLMDKLLIDQFSAKVMAQYRKHCDMLTKYELIANGFVFPTVNKGSIEGECDEDF